MQIDSNPTRIIKDAALLQTFNKAALILQRSSHNEQEFMSVFRELITSLGYNGSICLLSENHTFLTVKTIAYPSGLMTYLEEMTGFKAIGFKFRLDSVDIFKNVIETRKTVYIQDNTQVITQLLPRNIGIFHKAIQIAIGGSPIIYAPFISGDKILGVLSIEGKNLDETDIITIEAFANHIAITLDNLYLLLRLKTNEEKLRCQTEDLRLINKLNEALNMGKPLCKIFSLLSRETIRIFECKGAAIYLYNPYNNILNLQDIHPGSIIAESIEQLIGINTKNLKIKIKPGNLFDIIVNDKNYHLLHESRHIKRYVNEFIEAIEFSNESIGKNLKELLARIVEMINVDVLLIFPMIAGDEIIGIIEIAKEGTFAEEDIYRLETISGQLTSAITHKQNEDQLQRLSHAIKQSPSMILITDIHGYIQYANAKFTEVTGYSLNDIYGKHVRLLKSGKTSSVQYKHLWQTISSGGEWRGEFYNRKKNHKLFWVDAHISPIRNNEGEIIYYLAVKNDITEKRKMQEELFKIKKLESIGILAGGIAHDFNNLLSGILGNINLAKIYVDNFYSEENKELSTLLSEAETASHIAKDLTRQLLTFSKSGTPVKKAISLVNLIKETVCFTLRGSNVKWEFQYQDDLWPVEIDNGQMSQVINNLIINADQAMKDGGLLIISAKNIYINNLSPLPGGEYVVISFKDQGIGIPEENISKIFDPYFSTKEDGNGLGLATSHSIIKKHNGIIWVESIIGIGSTFYVYLPSANSSVDDKKEGEIKMDHRNSGRVLIMDDEEIVRHVARKMLERLGYEVTEVNDGIDVIRIFTESLQHQNKFDLVILDLTIPGGMGGKETIKELRKINPEVKAIVSSGYSNDPIMADYEKYGFDGIVEKPYKLSDLESALKQVLYSTE